MKPDLHHINVTTPLTIASVLVGCELTSGISALSRAANSSSESLLKLGELKSLWLDEVECGDSGRLVAATISSSAVAPGNCRTDGGWYTERKSSPLERMACCGANISVPWSMWDAALGKPANNSSEWSQGSILGCDTAYLGWWCLLFQSRIFLGLLNPEDEETMVLWNVRKHWPSNAVSHPRRPESLQNKL